MKQLFVDAEKGVFNSEENNNNALPLNLAKKKKVVIACTGSQLMTAQCRIFNCG